MSFAAGIRHFFEHLQPPEDLPKDVQILWPYSDPAVRNAMARFVDRYFRDTESRHFLIGINPGRFGAGITGICFTDPVRLAEDCGIDGGPGGPRELSSDFVYRMISAFGGPEVFYRRFYLTALSPVGFLRDGKNLNYYDVKGLPEQLDAWMADAMARQIKAGARRDVAFSLGKGANFKYLQTFNERHGFFDQIEALPHPRWVMQYRRKRLEEFIRVYVETLSQLGD